MKKILVTGINGFVGNHVAHELLRNGFQVVGLGADATLNPWLRHKVITYFACDLSNSDQVKKLPLEDFTAIINLAGLASVGESFEKPELYKQINVAVLTTICDRLVRKGINTRVIAISTGAIYDSRQSMPLTEDSNTITQGSPYALSKLLMEKAARKYQAVGLDLVIARPFNHVGPGQRPGFLVPDLFNKIQAALKNKTILKVGDLETRRDYTDVRDVVQAYSKLALARFLKHDIYNVCSGRSVPGKQIMQLLLKELGSLDLKIKIDEALLRPLDPKELFGSNERLKTEVGWQPKIPLEQTIKDFVSSAT